MNLRAARRLATLGLLGPARCAVAEPPGTAAAVAKPGANRCLVDRELGIYGQLGTICEDR